MSLEDAFWAEFRDIAAKKGMHINALASEVDVGRSIDVGLASAIRVYVLEQVKKT